MAKAVISGLSNSESSVTRPEEVITSKDRIKREFGIAADVTRFDNMIDTLIELEDSAFGDQQLTIQSNPESRDIASFGQALIRQGERDKIRRTLQVYFEATQRKSTNPESTPSEPIVGNNNAPTKP